MVPKLFSRKRPEPNGSNNSRGRMLTVGLLALLAAAVLAMSFFALSGVASSSTPGLSARPLPTYGSPRADPTLVTFLGDSYTAGSRQDSGKAFRWPSLVSSALNVTSQNLGAGGAGYATANGNNKTIATQARLVSGFADVVVLFGSINDLDDYDGVKAAAGVAVAESLRRSPEAKILLVGPTWFNSEVPARLLSTRDALRDLAEEQGITFVDPLAESWLMDGPSGLIGSDGIHPTDAGHAYLAEKMQPLIAALLPDQDD